MLDSQAFRVLIVGGGCAALEAAFRLQRVAGDRVETVVVAPDEHFSPQAMRVLAPFAAGDSAREPLARLTSEAGAELRRGRLASVDVAGHEVLTSDGRRIAYDALLIAVGGVRHAPFRHALTFGLPGGREQMHGLVQDLEEGYSHRIAFVVPTGASWPMAVYEMALMAAGRAYDMCQPCDLTLITPENAPLALFGSEASGTLTGRLRDAGVTVRAGVHARVPSAGLVELHPGGERLHVDRIVSLATLTGPAVAGLPHDAQGFLPVDRHGRVHRAPDVYAAGDATNFPIKQGGLACQQADAAAEMIAARAGAAVDPQPYAAVLRGILLTEHDATFMRRDASGLAGDDAAASSSPLWWPPAKLAGRELALHIDTSPRRLAGRLPEEGSGAPPLVDIDLSGSTPPAPAGWHWLTPSRVPMPAPARR
jgi:sulfide:quinone oxidoreductase